MAYINRFWKLANSGSNRNGAAINIIYHLHFMSWRGRYFCAKTAINHPEKLPGERVDTFTQIGRYSSGQKNQSEKFSRKVPNATGSVFLVLLFSSYLGKI